MPARVKCAFGLFSTIFVSPVLRNRGLAQALVEHVEAWLRLMHAPRVFYYTAWNHVKIIRLFERNGYAITDRQTEMVQLSKVL